MKKHLKLAILIIVFCLNKTTLFSQTTTPGTKLEYTYDANGNRITRTIITVTLLAKFNMADTMPQKKETPS